MTMRNKTLTAVAALSFAFAGPALSQDDGLAPGVSAPAGSSYAQTQPAPAGAEEATEATPEAAEAEAAAEPEAEPEPTEAEAEPAEDVTEAEPEEAPVAEAETGEAEAGSEAEAETGEAPAEEEAPAQEEAAEPEADEPEAADAEAVEPEAAAEPEVAEEEAAEPETTEEASDESTEAAPAEEAEEASSDEGEPVEGETAVEEPAAEEPVIEEEATEEEATEEAAATQHIEDVAYSFEGPFGKYDQFQLQRGLQVYTEICSACHGLQYVPIRTLSDPNGVGLPADQVRAYAAGLAPIYDPEIDEERERLPTDHFPAVSGMGMGPDLSLMAKARAGFHGPYGTGISQLFNGIGGPEYIHAILTQYTGEDVEQAGSVLYVNNAFAGGLISMPMPMFDDMIEYQDGTAATVDQMARDVSAFLMWAAEPKLMDRKQVGLVSVLFLVLLTALLYLTNKRLWRPVKHPEDQA